MKNGIRHVAGVIACSVPHMFIFWWLLGVALGAYDPEFRGTTLWGIYRCYEAPARLLLYTLDLFIDIDEFRDLMLVMGIGFSATVLGGVTYAVFFWSYRCLMDKSCKNEN